MAGRRINERAHHGPAEDRAKKPEGDRKKTGTRYREPDTRAEGLSAKDAARKKAWEQT